MRLSVRATLGTVPNFFETLKATEAVFKLQDEDIAEGWFAELRGKLREMVALLAWPPAIGSPARFLDAKSAQEQLQLVAVLRSAKQVELSDLCV